MVLVGGMRDRMKASAFIVGPDDGPGAALRSLAKQIGFEGVYPHRDIADAERQSAMTPLIYFLFAAAESLASIKPIAALVRASESPRVRFAPMIYFSDSPSLETIRACIGMGFDDIITLPFTLSRVEERLDRQLDRTLVYYETETYFGPDRRNRTENEEGHSGRGSGGQYRRMEIIRAPSFGVNVVSDDTQIVI
jgi:hypothetical protein